MTIPTSPQPPPPPPPNNNRTAKVEHASLNPRAEACWYFTEARSQFRLSGTLAVIGARAAAEDARAARLRLAAWERLSPGTREWHSGPAPGAEKKIGDGGGGGGKEVLSGPAATVAAAERASATASGRGGGAPSAEESASASKPPPHDNFCLVLLDVDAVDHVDLEADERTLWELELEEGEGGRGGGEGGGGGGGKVGEWRSRAVWP